MARSAACIFAVLLAGCGSCDRASERASEVAAQADQAAAKTYAEIERAPIDRTRTLARIAFGSCNHVDFPQPLWKSILAQQPDLWIWLGDNIYADTEDMGVMTRMYAAQLAQPDYRKLVAKVPVVGTWDDHDYGANDMGRGYPKKRESQVAMLDFLGEPADSPRRAQKGVYVAYDFGAAPRKVRIILLDTRYHRQRPGPDTDMLGEAQWAWLEGQLVGSDAAVHVIGSSVQLIANEHPFEKWGKFPKARERLLALIQRSDARNVIVISGDRHRGEVSRLARAGHPPLYDITSSSLNAPLPVRDDEPNAQRVGHQVFAPNFGVLRIDWDAAVMHMELHGETGVLLRHSTPLEPAPTP